MKHEHAAGRSARSSRDPGAVTIDYGSGGMARPRAFDVQAAITTAGEVFARPGYSATSIDDLVNALGLHRRSLYQAFGSKRGLFLAALRQSIAEELPEAKCSRVGGEALQRISLRP